MLEWEWHDLKLQDNRSTRVGDEEPLKLKVGKNGYLLGQVQCQILYQFTQHKIMKGTHTVPVNHEHYTSCTVQEHICSLPSPTHIYN